MTEDLNGKCVKQICLNNHENDKNMTFSYNVLCIFNDSAQELAIVRLSIHS